MGIRGGITGINMEYKRLKKNVETEAIGPLNTAIRRAAMAAIKSFMKNSPVWSGETVRNYKVAIGSTPRGLSAPVQGRVFWPQGPFPEDLQNEQRREANEAAALADARAALKPTFKRKTLVRNVQVGSTLPASKAALIEAGAAPSPDRSRYPGGLSAKARQAARAASEGKIK
jgi:hypothetical protein